MKEYCGKRAKKLGSISEANLSVNIYLIKFISRNFLIPRQTNHFTGLVHKAKVIRGLMFLFRIPQR